MFGDKLSSVRQSLQMKASAGAKVSALRDSAKAELPEYSIDVELSDNNKKMLEAFKQNSGYYHVSPKKQQKGGSPVKKSVPPPSVPEPVPVQCPRIYLFGNKNGDYLAKADQDPNPNPILQSQALPLTSTQKPSTNPLPDTAANSLHSHLHSLHSNLHSQSQSLTPALLHTKHKQFLKEVLQTVGIVNGNGNDSKLQFEDLINQAYTRFVDMKSNGRWQLVLKCFKGEEDQLNYSCITSTNRSIIKKKSLMDTQALGERKKVKVVQPETTSQLIRTKFKLAEQLETHIKSLTKGFKFQKFCFNSNKIEQINLYLSYDLKCLAWQSKGKEPIVESMLSYSGITDGARSKNFMKFIVRKVYIDELLAFSVILKNRTLDLVAGSVEEKERFVEGMKFVKSFT